MAKGKRGARYLVVPLNRANERAREARFSGTERAFERDDVSRAQTLRELRRERIERSDIPASLLEGGVEGARGELHYSGVLRQRGVGVLNEAFEEALRQRYEGALRTLDADFQRASEALHADLAAIEARSLPAAPELPEAEELASPPAGRDAPYPPDDGGSRVNFDEDEPASVVQFDELPTWEEGT